jgi:hypothetical protein
MTASLNITLLSLDHKTHTHTHTNVSHGELHCSGLGVTDLRHLKCIRVLAKNATQVTSNQYSRVNGKVVSAHAIKAYAGVEVQFHS